MTDVRPAVSEELASIQQRLGAVDDPIGFLAGFFAHAPTGLAIWKRDGHLLLTNRAFRELFGSEPPPDYNIMNDDVVDEGLRQLIRRAFGGETSHLPTFWYDPRDLQHVTVTEGKRVAISMTVFPVFDRGGRIDYVAATYRDETEVVEVREHLQLETELLQQLVQQMLADTEEREKAEVALAKSEAYYKALIQRSTDVIQLLGADGRIVFVSPSVTRLLGYSREDMLAMYGYELLHPDELEALGERFQKILQADPGASDLLEQQVRHKDGSYRWVEVAVTNLLADPVVQAVVVNYHDITERKQIEDGLRRSELHLQASQRIASLGSWELDLEDHYDVNRNRLHWSDEVFRIFGYQPGEIEVTSEAFFAAVHPDDRDAIQQAVAAALSGGPAYSIDHRVIRPDGSERVVHEQCEIIVDEATRKPVKMMGTVHDITERKRVEDMLRRQEEQALAFQDRLRALHQVYIELEQAATLDDLCREAIILGRQQLGFDRLGLFLTGEEGRRALGTWGTDPQGRLREEKDIVFEPYEDPEIGEQDASRWNIAVAHNRQILDRGQVVGRGSTALVLLGHVSQPVGWLATDNLLCQAPLTDDQLEMLNLYANTLAALILRKQAQTEAQRLNEELEERVRLRTAQLQVANEELESFSYSVSHDLRTPLRAIDGFSQILVEDYNDRLDAEGRAVIQRVRDASQRMGALIDDLLDLSRVTRREIKRGPVDLSAMVQHTAQERQATQPERDVEFVIAPGLKANADANLLRIVIDNLLGNAWKYTSKHPRARIEFGAEITDGLPVYFVRDDGAGFDPAFADKLFGPFQRLHSMDDFEGNGIGLATVQRIIQRHGGQVWAEGAVEQGATFYFTLPG